MMHSFPQKLNALVIGATGAIGSAFIDVLQTRCPHGVIIGLHRHSHPAIDFAQESSIADAAEALSDHAPFHIIINAAGILHTTDFMPEKKLSDLHYAQMLATFQTNTFGPAMVIRHFAKWMDQERSVMAMISAKVGSIEDNRLGGWYSYRASKAALNMYLKTSAIEIRRTKPNAVLIALHPGTVSSHLSKPFRGAETGRSARDAVMDMLDVMDGVTAEDTGQFYSYNGQKLPW